MFSHCSDEKQAKKAHGLMVPCALSQGEGVAGKWLVVLHLWSGSREIMLA